MSTTQGKSKDSMNKSKKELKRIIVITLLITYIIVSAITILTLNVQKQIARQTVNQQQAEKIAYGIALKKCLNSNDEKCKDLELNEILDWTEPDNDPIISLRQWIFTYTSYNNEYVVRVSTAGEELTDKRERELLKGF